MAVIIESFMSRGWVVDSNHDGDVYASTANGGDFQKWEIANEAGGSPEGFLYTLRNVATGLYLDSNDNGDLYTLPGNGGPYQWWSYHPSLQTLRNAQTQRFLLWLSGIGRVDLSTSLVVDFPPVPPLRDVRVIWNILD